MRFEPREITLKNGKICTLRPTHPDDAEQMIEYMKQTAGETEFLLRYPDEILYTPESERELLGRILEDPDAVMMVGIVDGEVAGNCSIGGFGPKRKLRHRCSMAIALKKEYWNLGIGRAMISHLTELAKLMGFSQIDLEVVAENTRAQALYEKCGFLPTGRRSRALLFDDGTYHDEILMVKYLDEGGE